MLPNALRSALVAIGAIASMACFFFAVISLSRALKVGSFGALNGRAALSPFSDEPLGSCRNPEDAYSVDHDGLPLWGSFRPGDYFGMKTRTPGAAMAVGMMWSSVRGTNIREYRHQTSQGALDQLEWLEHDGTNFGVEAITDNQHRIRLQCSFVIPGLTTEHESVAQVTWAQRIEMFQQSTVQQSVLLYLGADCPTSEEKKECIAFSELRDLRIVVHSKKDQSYLDAVSLIGYSRISGWFSMMISVSPILDAADSDSEATAAVSDDHAAEISYVGLANMDLLSGTDRLKRDGIRIGSSPPRSSGRGKKTRRSQESVFSESGDLANALEPNSSFVAFEISYSGATPMRIDVIMFEHIPEISSSIELVNAIEKGQTSEPVDLLPHTVYGLSHDFSLDMTSVKNISPSFEWETAAATASVKERLSRLARARREKSKLDQEKTYSVSSQLADDLSYWLAHFSTLFDAKFADIYAMRAIPYDRSEVRDVENASAEPLSPKGFDELDEFLAKKTLSSLLGGIGYFYGSPRVEPPIDDVLLQFSDTTPESSPPSQGTTNLANAEETTVEESRGKSARVSFTSPVEYQYNKRGTISRREGVALFSATPSRTVFPRGFLWDEGFHQFIISEWDAKITMSVLAHWLNSMHFHCDIHATAKARSSLSSSSSLPQPSASNEVRALSAVAEYPLRCGGWIPREMILGDEATRRVPEEFVAQRLNIANPPTLLLVVEQLLNRLAPTDEEDRIEATIDRVSAGVDIEGELTPAKSSPAAPSASTSDRTRLQGSSSSGFSNRRRFSKEESAKVSEFLRGMYPLLDRWIEWFLHSQRGGSHAPNAANSSRTDNYSFRWRGRSQTDQKVVPNTLASGLDDYPRSHLPSVDEHHVDLHCWMIKACQVMRRLSALVGTNSSSAVGGSAADAGSAGIDHSANGYYQQMHETLLGKLDELHWSDRHQGYFDVGITSERAEFATALFFRCSNPTDGSVTDVLVPIERMQESASYCPKSHPRSMFLMGDGSGGYKTMERFVPVGPLAHTHIPRVGYVTIFPLLLALLPLESPRLAALLNIVEDRKHLWTDFGLRSMSTKDMFYLKMNSPGDAPYWRGPIWVNINYLALSGLHYYGTSDTSAQSTSNARSQQQAVANKQRALHLYHRLRANLLRNVLSEYKRTGFLWEQYDDRTGRGMRGHPFTGWTATILNIMGEKYLYV